MKADVDWQGMMASQDPHFGQTDDMCQVAVLHCTLILVVAVLLSAVQYSAVEFSVVKYNVIYYSAA